jgi:molecular chaperone DnaJ
MATTIKRDFYEVLGLSKSASDSDVKKAYRTLARKHHPDVDKSEGAAENFKEISEAYQVLSDPEKRKAYDQFGHSAFDRNTGSGEGSSNPFGSGYRTYNYGTGGQGFNSDFGGFEDPFTIFEQFFGGASSRSRQSSRGEDLHYELTIEFRDAIFGTHKTLSIAKDITCSICQGTGAENDSKISTCPDCQGTGQIRRIVNSILGQIATAAVCPTCKGSGKKIEKPCHKCHGSGVTKENIRQEINIPKGIEDGDTIRFSGLGAAGKNGQAAGELYLTIRVLPDRKFRRRGDSIYFNIEVAPSTAVLGEIVTLPTLNGTAQLKIPTGTQPGTEFRLRGYGVPNRGDLYVTVNVKIPTKLSKDEKKLWESLAKPE